MDFKCLPCVLDYFFKGYDEKDSECVDCYNSYAPIKEMGQLDKSLWRERRREEYTRGNDLEEEVRDSI